MSIIFIKFSNKDVNFDIGGCVNKYKRRNFTTWLAKLCIVTVNAAGSRRCVVYFSEINEPF